MRKLGGILMMSIMFRDAGTRSEGGENPEAAALLKKINDNVSAELEKRGYQNRDAVNAIVSETLKGLNLEALRSFDAEKMETSIKNIAGELEKVKNSGTTGGAEQRGNPLQEQLEKNMANIELAMRQKKKVNDGGTVVELNIRAAAVMTTTNTTDETAVPDAMIESMSLAEFVPKRRGDQFIGEIADRTVVQEITQYKTWLEEGSEEGAFAIVAEGALKPLVSTALVRNVATAKKIAGKYVITEEFTKFRKEAYNIIKRLVNDKLMRDYAALLVVDLNAQAASYTGSIMDDLVVAPNDYDAIGAVAAQIQGLNFVPDILILNPADAWRIRLTKDDEGRYLFPTTTDNGVVTMLGIRVIESTYQTVGSFTLGESKLFKIEEEPITVRIGYGVTVTGASPVTAVVSDFDNNQMRIIVETFFLDYIATNNIGSFVKTTFATVKAALLKP